MATYYWYGGAGNWSDYTNHWSNNSGNSPSSPAANAPTSADNVIFDDNSAAGTFTVTVDGTSNCADYTVNITNAAKKMTLAGSAALNVYGSWSNSSSTYYAATYSGTITFASTATGKTITTNGVTITAGSVVLDGVGGAWTLGSALTITTNLTVTNGTFSTSASNYALTVSRLISDNSNSRTISLNGSTVTCSFNAVTAVDFNTSTNLTLNAGTSQLNISAGNGGMRASTALTFYNVSFTSTGGAFISLTGTFTYNNLTFTSRSTDGIIAVTLGGDITVNGTLTLGAANTAVRRIFFASSAIGTQRTLTVATFASTTDIDFRDMAAAGASVSGSNWNSAGTGRFGDCKGNNNKITFDATKTVYWNLSGTQNWSATGWATTNNGSPAANNFPLAQDVATFTEAGAAGTVTINTGWNIGSIQMADGVSNRTTAFTLATSTNTFAISGSVTLFSSLTLSGTGAVTFSGQSVTQNITSAGITFTQPITVNSPGGTVKFLDNTTIDSARVLTLTGGTLDVNGKTLTIGTFASTGAISRVLAFGSSSTITVSGSGATAWNTSGSGLTTTGTGTITMTSASAKTFVGGGYSWSTLNQGGAGALTISGSNTFADISNTYKATGAATITITAGTTQTVAAFSASGESGRVLTLNTSSAGTQATLSSSAAAISVSYCSVKDSFASGGARWRAYKSNGCTNAGNNIGWTFISQMGFSGFF